MSKSKSKSIATVSPLWVDALYGNEDIKICIINGVATVRVYNFDFDVPGMFEQDDLEAVIMAYGKLITTKPTFIELPDDWEPPPWNPPEKFVLIADLELEVEETHEVIYMHEVKRGD